MNQSKKNEPIQIISIILIIVGLAIFIFIGVKIKLFSFNKKAVDIPISYSIPQEEYDQWKTFLNSEIKYSIKYPQNWVLEEKSSSEIYLYSPSRFQLKSNTSNSIASNIFLKIYNSVSDLPENTKNLNLEDWVKLQNGEENTKNITIKGINGYEVLTSYPTKMIFFQKEDLIYSIFDSSAGNNPIQQQIIDSLEFN